MGGTTVGGRGHGGRSRLASRNRGISTRAGPDETVRLAELGELTAAELAALHEAATEARLRIGTDSEKISGGWRQTPGAVSMDARDVELWERVEAALSNQARS
jgi:hypothetical protein